MTEPVVADNVPVVAENLPTQRGDLGEGERVLFIDSKNRRYLVHLVVDGEFHSHAGHLSHNEVIGQPEGVEVRSQLGARFVVLRPTLIDHILKMPRGAQVIYPKDLGPILMFADIFPGARVLETGVGSGALSTTLVRAGAVVTGYELREDFAEVAIRNVAEFLGDSALDRYNVEIRNSYDGIADTGFDRVILDLPEPWQVIPHLDAALKGGGIVVAYSPSIMQVAKTRKALDAGPYAMIETVEVLHRTWHVDGYSVRPDHRMVAHTGFLTHARSQA